MAWNGIGQQMAVLAKNSYSLVWPGMTVGMEKDCLKPQNFYSILKSNFLLELQVAIDRNKAGVG